MWKLCHEHPVSRQQPSILHGMLDRKCVGVSGDWKRVGALEGWIRSVSVCQWGSIGIVSVLWGAGPNVRRCVHMTADTLLPMLTVYEMLLYTAELKLPLKVPLKAKRERVLQIVQVTDLSSCTLFALPAFQVMNSYEILGKAGCPYWPCRTRIRHRSLVFRATANKLGNIFALAVASTCKLCWQTLAVHVRCTVRQIHRTAAVTRYYGAHGNVAVHAGGAVVQPCRETCERKNM
jgi:hypothetical protein